MKKLLSVVLMLAVSFSVLTGFNIASAASIKYGQTADGTTALSISVGAQDENNATTLERDVLGVCGKDATDKIFKLTKTVGTGSEGRCTLEPFIGWEMNVRALISFDVCFMSEDASFNVGYAASIEGAQSSAADQCNNINSFFTMSPTGGFQTGKMFTLTQDLQVPLEVNRWYNIAIEVPNDQTSTAYVYINGKKYTGNFHKYNDDSEKINSYGVRHMRINHLSGVLGIDNYYLNTSAQETDMYDNSLYCMEEISFSQNEKITYEEDKNCFKILDPSCTAGEVKSFINAGTNNVTVYKSETSNTVVSDADVVEAANIAVVSNGNGAYRYYKFYCDNVSDFEIKENDDLTSVTVTGLKEGFIPTLQDTVIIPEKIAGYTVTAIGDNAFENKTTLGKIQLPNTVKSIGKKAFAKSAITEFYAPDSLTSICADAFDNCSSLKTVHFCENSNFTSLPEGMFFAESDNLFSDMSLYIPKTIKNIPANLLKNFKDKSNVKIYGEYDSAAREFAKTVSEAIEDGSYTNELGGKLASVTFVEYDFETDSAVVFDETGINKGDKTVNVATTTSDTVLTADVLGVGGKKADDTVISFTASSGHNGLNYIPGGSKVWEMSIMTPSENAANINLIYYYTEEKTNDARYGEDIVKVASDGVYVKNNKVVSSSAGRWFNIAVIAPDEGTDSVSVYINGVKYNATLSKTFYGINRYAFYKSGGLSTLYFDNFRLTDSYDASKNAAAVVSSSSDAIGIYDEGIVYADENATYTAGELKNMINTNVGSRANVRVYTDSKCTNEIGDDENVESGAVLVVAATNGYSHERTYSYYPINPPINTTLYAIEVNDDAVTATVTGWNQKNITAVDDLSIVAIPEKIAGYTITAIGDNAFSNNTEIESINLPDTVKTIGSSAFAGKLEGTKSLGKIRTVKWPVNLKTIGANAFSYQSALEEVNIPYGVETVGAMAFYWNDSLKKAVLPETVTTMGNNVFRLCGKLEYVKLSGGVKTIPKETFAGSNNVKTLVIPAGVTADAGAFIDYSNVDPVIYGNSNTFAQSFADEHGYKFVNSIGGVITKSVFMGNGDKEIIGSDYDINYGFDKIYLNATYSNISSDAIEAVAIIAAYDDTGAMLGCNFKNITIECGETVSITNDDNLLLEKINLKNGYTLKAMLWRKDNNEPLDNVTEVTMDDENKEVHVLLIGNSYGNDSFGYIREIAAADNITLKTYNLYIGGGALYAHHYKYALSGEAKYQPVINMDYKSYNVSIEEGLKSDKWDYVALQANSSEGEQFRWFFESDYALATDKNGVKYSQYWQTLSDKVSLWAPGAEKLTHMTWGPSDEVAFNRIVGSSLSGLGGEKWDSIRNAGYSGYDDANYVKGSAREAYYETVKDRYEEGNTYFSGKDENMIPSAVAVYLAITKYGFDEFVLNDNGEYNTQAAAMYRDTTCHLTMPYGRVLAGLTWYETLTGNDVTKNTYQMSGITQEDMAKLKAAAHEACQMYN